MSSARLPTGDSPPAILSAADVSRVIDRMAGLLNVASSSGDSSTIRAGTVALRRTNSCAADNAMLPPAESP